MRHRRLKGYYQDDEMYYSIGLGTYLGAVYFYFF